MQIAHIRNGLVMGAAALALSACGGSGGGVGIASNLPPPPPAPTPTPTPTPTPSGASTVTIFPSPTPMGYASVGGSMASPGESASSRFKAISTADVDQPHIRYSSAGYYEIQLPGQAWDTLVPYKGLLNPTTDNTSFQPAGAAQNASFFNTVTARWAGYAYSEYANWSSRDLARSGWVGIGIPTSPAGVPAAGSASYLGTVHGSADIMQFDGLAGAYFPSAVDGTVTLNFNFQQGSLSGGVDLNLADGMSPLHIGSFTFKDTVYSVGSTTYSGSFDTAVNGSNFFLGRFTGPHAEETIGAWAVPFIFNQSGDTVTADGQVHQAFGAWVAKH